MRYVDYISTYQDRHILHRNMFSDMLEHERIALENGWTVQKRSDKFVKQLIKNLHKQALKENKEAIK